MKNPLTSKERRGLVAVAAAALLCIGEGFIFRSCGSRNAGGAAEKVVIVDNDSVWGAARGDSVEAAGDRQDSIVRKSRRSKSESSNGKRGRGTKKQRAEKTYPSRSPLDEPCD